jgi:hypothetical protein
VHADAPVASLYVPAPHAVHVPPSGPDQPTLQVQLLKAVLCSGELESAGQLLQLSAPDTILYLPATHAVHVSPSAPEDPALHVQLLKAVLCSGEPEFGGQLMQV